MFDDALLDDPEALSLKGDNLRHLALAGARLRRDHTDEMVSVVDGLSGMRPRSVLVIGAEARLIRAVVEPFCPVPCVAWAIPGLPPWAGPLDLVIVLAGLDSRLLPSCLEALKRGSLLFVVAPQGSPLLDESPSVAMIPTQEDDPLVSAMLVLKVLDMLGLGPELDLDEVADTLDSVAQTCGPRYGLEVNPAKNLACALADVVPLIWGGSVLAARASRRVAEAVREATALPALAADDEDLLPLVIGSHPRDLFADPFEDQKASMSVCLLILDDGEYSLQGVNLAQIAQSRGVRVEHIRTTRSNPVLRYVDLLYQGLFAAGYLGLATVKES